MSVGATGGPTQAALCRARHVPGVIVAIGSIKLVLSLVVAFPIASAVGASGIGAWPAGDAVLFDPGGILLVELLRLHGTMLFGAVKASALTWLLAASLGLYLTAWLMAALCLPRSMRTVIALQRASQVLPRFAVLGLVCVVLQAILLIAATVVGGIVLSQVSGSDRKHDLTAVAFVALAIASLFAVGLLHDLARAAVVRRDAGVLSALRASLEHFALRPLELALGWVAPMLVAALAIFVAALAATAIDVRTTGGFCLIAALHQLAALTLVAARANWLARALRTATPSGDTPQVSSVEVAASAPATAPVDVLLRPPSG